MHNTSAYSTSLLRLRYFGYAQHKSLSTSAQYPIPVCYIVFLIRQIDVNQAVKYKIALQLDSGRANVS
ncbi:hypothetical protein [Nostoc sp. CCY 9925]|uniref:hypothetical protein n=1 Tax=Nostoc sp. CCY 9925 TaxID=3103865 RepID=UPI0039C6F4C4